MKNKNEEVEDIFDDFYDKLYDIKVDKTLTEKERDKKIKKLWVDEFGIEED